jgi:hypothetical protein
MADDHSYTNHSVRIANPAVLTSNLSCTVHMGDRSYRLEGMTNDYSFTKHSALAETALYSQVI